MWGINEIYTEMGIYSIITVYMGKKCHSGGLLQFISEEKKSNQ